MEGARRVIKNPGIVVRLHLQLTLVKYSATINLHINIGLAMMEKVAAADAP